MFVGKLLTMLILIIALVAFSSCDGGNGGGGGSGAGPDNDNNQPSESYQTYGIDFSAYMGIQDPNLVSIVAESQIKDRLEIIAPYTQ
jgi:hypothetical protein